MCGRERVYIPHASKILPPELLKTHSLLVVGLKQGSPSRPGLGPTSPSQRIPNPAGNAAIREQLQPPLPAAPSSLIPHLEYCANNSGVLLGKRDLIAAYTPREGKIGFSPDLISSLYLFFFPSLLLSLSSEFLFSLFQLPASSQ